MAYNADRSLNLLRLGSGLPDASFREGQEEAIRHVVDGLGRLLVVQRTGWGKSFVYFIATKLLREAGNGPALLISLLLSLMRNQIAAAERMGVRAATINSDNQDAWKEVEARVRRNEVDILLISPERLANERFVAEVLAGIARRISLLATANNRMERLTTLRHREQRQMQDYVRLPFGSHMSFLVSALDGDPNPGTATVLPPLPAGVDAGLVRAATAFLRRTNLPIEPRKKWPDGGMPRYRVKGAIAPGLQAQAGRALCVWGDAGWGGLVRQGKYNDRRFSDELVEACTKMMQDWKPQPEPTWITCVPSLRHPDLVPGFARRLAGALGLPFHSVLTKIDERPEQKTMANSTQQARNIDRSLALGGEAVPAGPVLLVHDMVGSRWTLTVSAWLLRSGGSGEVWPLALSLSGHDQ